MHKAPLHTDTPLQMFRNPLVIPFIFAIGWRLLLDGFDIKDQRDHICVWYTASRLWPTDITRPLHSFVMLHCSLFKLLNRVHVLLPLMNLIHILAAWWRISQLVWLYRYLSWQNVSAVLRHQPRGNQAITMTNIPNSTMYKTTTLTKTCGHHNRLATHMRTISTKCCQMLAAVGPGGDRESEVAVSCPSNHLISWCFPSAWPIRSLHLLQPAHMCPHTGRTEIKHTRSRSTRVGGPSRKHVTHMTPDHHLQILEFTVIIVTSSMKSPS